MAPFVDRVRIESYRCIRSLDLRLTRLHALIGPNDSGKSSILQAILHGSGTFWLSDLAVARSSGKVFRGTFPEIGQRIPGNTAEHASIVRHLGCRLLRLDPDAMRVPMPLIPKNSSLWFASDKGQGLASLYDALLSRDRDAFAKIDSQFRKLFPHVKALRLENADQQHKTMGITLLDKTDVGPEAMSEGMLYWLAFAVIEQLNPAGILLIEEPENGLHPARIREVMRILREVSQHTQILLATHSPLVINELQPEEVTIVTRKVGDTTRCTPMAETKNFAERSKVYALGELWLSYADGDLERELVAPSTEAAKAG